MSDSIFLVGADGVLTEVVGTAYEDEADLQKLLAENIQLLPGAQIDQDHPRRWLLIKREAGVPDHEGGGGWWSVDHLAVDQDGVPTFIEVKRASDTRARREVVAQMLDYAANGSMFWTAEQLRSLFEDDDPQGATERLMDLIGGSDGEAAERADAFWQTVGTNLREGRVRLIFVADEIPASLRRLVEFLNEQMPRIEVLALEIRQYRQAGSSTGALVSRLVGQTARAQAAKQPAAMVTRRSRPWTADEVMESIASAASDVAAVASAVHDWAVAHPHIRITGGTGVSYPSFTMAVGLGRSASSFRAVLSLYGTPGGDWPMLEIRIRQMLATPPYDRDEARGQLIADLQSLGIPRLSVGDAMTSERPNVPLTDLTSGRVGALLAVIDRWIQNVRAEVRP
jgi:hypothetical protein